MSKEDHLSSFLLAKPSSRFTGFRFFRSGKCKLANVGKVGRARAIARRASLSPAAFSYSARRSARIHRVRNFSGSGARPACPVFILPL